MPTCLMGPGFRMLGRKFRGERAKRERGRLYMCVCVCTLGGWNGSWPEQIGKGDSCRCHGYKSNPDVPYRIRDSSVGRGRGP